MKGINHLVLASDDLEALRSAYQALGFAVKQRGGLPFGISNSIVQLQGSYLELLSVTGDVPEHSSAHFSFGAFNRDYLRSSEAGRCVATYLNILLTCFKLMKSGVVTPEVYKEHMTSLFGSVKADREQCNHAGN